MRLRPAGACMEEDHFDEKYYACAKYLRRQTAQQRHPGRGPRHSRGAAAASRGAAVSKDPPEARDPPAARVPQATEATEAWRANSASSFAAWFRRRHARA
jgi:hypothetical protein